MNLVETAEFDQLPWQMKGYFFLHATFTVFWLNVSFIAVHSGDRCGPCAVSCKREKMSIVPGPLCLQYFIAVFVKFVTYAAPAVVRFYFSLFIAIFVAYAKSTRKMS